MLGVDKWFLFVSFAELFLERARNNTLKKKKKKCHQFNQSSYHMALRPSNNIVAERTIVGNADVSSGESNLFFGENRSESNYTESRWGSTCFRAAKTVNNYVRENGYFNVISD